MNVLYRPVFLHGQEAINTFRCYPEAQSDGAMGGKRVIRDVDDREAADTNILILKTAFVDLTYAHRRGDKVRLMAPIDARVLDDRKACAQLVATFKELDAELRKTVIPEVFNFPETLGLSRLEEITIPLLPFFDFYLAEAPADTADFTDFANINYLGISLDLENTEGEPDEIAERLTAVWAGTTKRRLKLCIQGISDEETLNTTRRYEAFATDGPVLSPDLPVLGKVAQAPAEA